jgi:YD repeat-containing protein
VGRLVKAERGTGATIAYTISSYDPMGRIKKQWQATPYNVCCSSWLLTNTYDLAGDMLSYTNGLGYTFTQSFNTDVRLTQLTSSLVDGQHPGTLFSNGHYNALGQLVSATLGNGIAETRTYNNRGRLLTIGAGSAYSLSAMTYAGNGNVLSANDVKNGNWSYGYDDFNRLVSASGPGSYSWAYDRYGNRWQQNGAWNCSVTFSAGNNRIDSGPTMRRVTC